MGRIVTFSRRRAGQFLCTVITPANLSNQWSRSCTPPSSEETCSPFTLSEGKSLRSTSAHPAKQPPRVPTKTFVSGVGLRIVILAKLKHIGLQLRLLVGWRSSQPGLTRQSSGPAQKAAQAAYFYVGRLRSRSCEFKDQLISRSLNERNIKLSQ